VEAPTKFHNTSPNLHKIACIQLCHNDDFNSNTNNSNNNNSNYYYYYDYNTNHHCLHSTVIESISDAEQLLSLTITFKYLFVIVTEENKHSNTPF